MKKQFLHEHHNLQDKAKKSEYQERFQEEGDNYDRGGTARKRLLSFRGSSVFMDLRPFLSDDRQSLLQTLERHIKFAVDGEIGTVSQLRRNRKLAEEVQARYEMTERSVLRASDIVDVVKHPKKNSQFRVVEFTCFLQPAEPFPNPIFKKHFAFRINIAKPRPAK